MNCQCPHENCGQIPLPATSIDGILDVIFNALEQTPQNVREGFFAMLRERWCIYCGSDGPTYKCYCRS